MCFQFLLQYLNGTVRLCHMELEIPIVDVQLTNQQKHIASSECIYLQYVTLQLFTVPHFSEDF